MELDIPQIGNYFIDATGHRYRLDGIEGDQALIWDYETQKTLRIEWPPISSSRQVGFERRVRQRVVPCAQEHGACVRGGSGGLQDPRVPVLGLSSCFGHWSELWGVQFVFIADVGRGEHWAYEPNPEMCKLLRENMRGLPVEIHEVALGDPITGDHPRILHGGIGNPGCCSLYDVGEQTAEGIEVQLMDSSTLPVCDVMKIDTEGSDVEILEGYLHIDKLKVLLVEYHRSEDAVKIRALAECNGLTYLDCRTQTLRFAR